MFTESRPSDCIVPSIYLFRIDFNTNAKMGGMRALEGKMPTPLCTDSMLMRACYCHLTRFGKPSIVSFPAVRRQYHAKAIKLLSTLAAFLIFLGPRPAANAAQVVDCSLLDPRVEVSKAAEGKIQGSADTLYKIAKAEGKVEGKVESAAKNIQNNVPQSEKSNVQNRLLYVFCEMFANDKSIPAEKKFELYKIVLDRFAPPSSHPVIHIFSRPASVEVWTVIFMWFCPKIKQIVHFLYQRHHLFVGSLACDPLGELVASC